MPTEQVVEQAPQVAESMPSDPTDSVQAEQPVSTPSHNIHYILT